MDAGRVFAMRFASRLNRRLLAISGAMALLGATVGVAVGTSGLIGPDRVIHGCYNSDGNLRVISPSEKCPKGWAAIEWNQQGIQGATGAKGNTGPAGPAGPIGLTGAAGAAGTNGTNGVDGAQGPKGDAGAAGTNGTNGVDGAQGPKGDPGAAGTNGTNGVDGAQGPKGDTGAAGTNGTNGVDGAQGPKGDAGAALSNLSDLQGVPCTVAGVAASVQVAVAADGSIALTCVAPHVHLQVSVSRYDGYCNDSFYNPADPCDQFLFYPASVTLYSAGFKVPVAISTPNDLGYAEADVPVAPGLTVQLIADPPNVVWGGACSGQSGTCTVTMDAAKTVTATW
jgi:hypothetical protein